MRFNTILSLFQMLPHPVGKRLASGYQKVSPRTAPRTVWTREELLDGAERLFQRSVDVVICGHIHQPCHFRSGTCDLFVLGDWRDGGEYVEFDGAEFVMRKAGG
jgi:UDP-2,3-diacylglucosamine pyrophosphatase LpxH